MSSASPGPGLPLGLSPGAGVQSIMQRRAGDKTQAAFGNSPQLAVLCALDGHPCVWAISRPSRTSSAVDSHSPGLCFGHSLSFYPLAPQILAGSFNQEMSG